MDLYSDNDPKACAWLRELIADGHLPAGDVLEKDIREIDGGELARYRRVHLFGGIGGWGHALELAGWPAARPVWTASCPCQPFSAAGKRKGEADERHLWPALLALVAECRPDCLFGEQVASRDGYRWLDGVRTDLESEAYAVGAVDLPAACVGAPHVRQRLFWCATARHASGQRLSECDLQLRQPEHRRKAIQRQPATAGRSIVGDPSNDKGNGRRQGRANVGRRDQGIREEGDGSRSANDSGHSDLPDAGHPKRRRASGQRPDGKGAAEWEQETNQPGQCGPNGVSPNTDGRIAGDEGLQPSGEHRQYPEDGRTDAGSCGSFWGHYDLIHYRDGKTRRVEPGTFPLAHGVSARLVKLRGYGNAIVPQVAAAFIRAFLES